MLCIYDAYTSVELVLGASFSFGRASIVLQKSKIITDQNFTEIKCRRRLFSTKT